MNKKGWIANGAVGGAIVGASIGDKLSPVKYVGIPDTSWHMSNADGTVSHTMAAVQVLNESGHNTAMAIGAGLGAIVGGIAVHRALGRQFRK